jgi:hypothetical protein
MSNEWTTVDTSNPEKEVEKVEFEVEEEDSPTEVESSAPSSYEEPEQPKAEQKTEEEEQPQSGAQKRIRQLVKQKKERDEQIQSLMTRQAELEERLKAQQQELRSSLEKSFESAEEQINSRIAMAKDAYKQALDSGDTDQIVKAQELLSNAQSDATSLKFTKQQMPKEVEEQEQQKEVAAQPQYDRHAIEWAGKNPWFGQDNVMTTLALEVDQELKAEGYDPSEEDFYQEIDSRLKIKFPERFGGQAIEQEQRQQETSPPAQVVGGASRTSPASSGKKIRLSKEDVRLANKWGIPLEQYAAEKLKVEQADGEYTSVYN